MSIIIKVVERIPDQFIVIKQLHTVYSKDQYGNELIYHSNPIDVSHWQYEGYENELSYFTNVDSAISFAHKLNNGELTLKYPRTVLELTSAVNK